MMSRSVQRRISAQRKPGVDWEAERKEFEAWYKNDHLKGVGATNNFDKYPNGTYKTYFVEVAWSAWRKARNTLPKVSFK